MLKQMIWLRKMFSDKMKLALYSQQMLLDIARI